MFTQKGVQNKPAEGMSRTSLRKAEIFVEGYVPTNGPHDLFDIEPAYRNVALFLKERGFRVETCAGFREGEELHGGEFDRPYTTCQFDVFTNCNDGTQARLSAALMMAIDAKLFKASVIALLDGAEEVKFENGVMTPESCMQFLKFVDNSDSVEVTYTLRGKREKFEF